MRIAPLTATLIGLVITALSVGCGSKTAPEPGASTSTAPGTLVKPTLGTSSAVAAPRPAPAAR
jgi:hypothetical protein